MFNENLKNKLSKSFGKLPERFKYTVHNIVAHPMSEIAYQLGFDKAARFIHDSTFPS